MTVHFYLFQLIFFYPLTLVKNSKMEAVPKLMMLQFIPKVSPDNSDVILKLKRLIAVSLKTSQNRVLKIKE